ncbi:T7SS effector LXG polymorphic toxin [Sediminibacillus sp. JSM 1682029]|uniref:T7SS effector LXG polymorphic toxin n=1 Tax=Sediminibacillus sp. JSM 1682029 TaxID=3229857 RepID=UPI0035249F9A
MVQKVDISEVISFSDDLYAETEQLVDKLNIIKANINLIIQMDSFKGKTANSAKDFFTELHTKTLSAFQELFSSLQHNIDSHIQAFHSEVDTSSSTILHSQYLQEKEEDIIDGYAEIKQTAREVNSTINRVLDITSVTTPTLSKVSSEKTEVNQLLNKLSKSFAGFVNTGSGDSDVKTIISEIKTMLNEASKKTGTDRFNDENIITSNMSAITLAVSTAKESRTFNSSHKMYRAGKQGVLSTSEHPDMRRGKNSYRINANKRALYELGVKPDGKATSDFNYRLPKDRSNWGDADYKRAFHNQTTLKYASKQAGQTGWSNTGNNVLKMHPEMKYWNDKVKPVGVLKTTGKAALEGAANSFTDPFKKGYGGIKGVSKSLGVFGTGLNYYSNYNDAKKDGLTGNEAVKRATVDTTVDTAVGGAIQTAFTAAGTAAIPIPGVGTAVGAIAGIGANWLLNKKWGKGKDSKSAMDVIKGWFH